MSWKMKFNKLGHPCWFDWENSGDPDMIEEDSSKEYKYNLIYKKNLYPDLVSKDLILIPKGSVGDENGTYRVLPKEVNEIKSHLVDNEISGIFKWIKKGQNYGLKLLYCTND